MGADRPGPRREKKRPARQRGHGSLFNSCCGEHPEDIVWWRAAEPPAPPAPPGCYRRTSAWRGIVSHRVNWVEPVLRDAVAALWVRSSPCDRRRPRASPTSAVQGHQSNVRQTPSPADAATERADVTVSREVARGHERSREVARGHERSRDN